MIAETVPDACRGCNCEDCQCDPCDMCDYCTQGEVAGIYAVPVQPGGVSDTSVAHAQHPGGEGDTSVAHAQNPGGADPQVTTAVRLAMWRYGKPMVAPTICRCPQNQRGPWQPPPVGWEDFLEKTVLIEDMSFEEEPTMFSKSTIDPLEQVKRICKFSWHDHKAKILQKLKGRKTLCKKMPTPYVYVISHMDQDPVVQAFMDALVQTAHRWIDAAFGALCAAFDCHECLGAIGWPLPAKAEVMHKIVLDHNLPATL